MDDPESRAFEGWEVWVSDVGDEEGFEWDVELESGKCFGWVLCIVVQNHYVFIKLLNNSLITSI